MRVIRALIHAHAHVMCRHMYYNVSYKNAHVSFMFMYRHSVVVLKGDKGQEKGTGGGERKKKKRKSRRWKRGWAREARGEGMPEEPAYPS